MKWLKSLSLAIVAAAVTALLLNLALPPVGWWPLAWIALWPVLHVSSGRGFLRGFLVGIASALLLGWLCSSGVFYADKSTGGTLNWTYLGCTMFGFVLATCCAIAGEVKKWTWRSVLGVASFAVLLELVLMPVLPSTIALSQARVPGMLLLSSVTGIWGVAFAQWAFNAMLTLVSTSHQPRLAKAPVAALAVLLLMGLLPFGSGEGGLRVSVVQSPSAELDVMEDLSRKGSPDIAVWPEFGGLAHVRSGDAETLVKLAASPGMPAFATSFPDGHQPRPRNTAVLFSSEGESARYYKRRLFGGERQMHVPGTEPVVAASTWGPVGLNICFDSCFPALMRDSSRMGEVGLIVLPTIDPESPHGFLAAMHAAFTPFRAAELGVAVARADGFAHSMVVSNTGKILVEIGSGIEDSAVAAVSPKPRWTVYKALGDWFLFACGLLLAACVVLGRRTKRNT